MRRTPWITYLWPGLPQLWCRGSWPALAVAMGAAAMLNLAIAVSFAWQEMLDSPWRNGLWLAMTAAWLASAGYSAVWVQRQRNQGDSASGSATFAKATELYLRGDYFQTERLLAALLRKTPRDIEARLMLATLLRRTGRPSEATRQLDQLARFEGAGQWELEIRREQELVAEAGQPQEEEVEEPAADEQMPPDESKQAA